MVRAAPASDDVVFGDILGSIILTPLGRDSATGDSLKSANPMHTKMTFASRCDTFEVHLRCS